MDYIISPSLRLSECLGVNQLPQTVSAGTAGSSIPMTPICMISKATYSYDYYTDEHDATQSNLNSYYMSHTYGGGVPIYQ